MSPPEGDIADIAPQQRLLRRDIGNVPIWWLLLAAVATPAAALAPVAEVPLERLVSLPTLSGTPPAAPAWSPDGEHLAFLWNDRGFPFRDLWVVPAGGGTPQRLTAMDPAADELQPFGEHLGPELSLSALRAESARRHAPGVSEFSWSRDGERLLFVYRGDIHAVAAGGGNLQRLSEGGGKSQLALSPDGRRLAFLQDGDLWLMRLEDGHLTRATQLGEPATGHVPGGAFSGHDVELRRPAFSADGRYIALEYVDRRAVRRMPIPSYLHEEPILHAPRRAYPGDSDEIHKVGIFDLEDDTLRFVALDEPDGRSVLAMAWSPVSAELLVEQDSHDGESRWLHLVSAADGGVRELRHDHRPRRIYPLFNSAWRSDGRAVFFIGDHEGHYRLYAMAVDDGRIRRLTPGDFDVAGAGFAPSPLQAVAATGELFYVSAAHSPYERHVYRIPQSGGAPARVTTLAGVHEGMSVSPDGMRVATVGSSDRLPGELYIFGVNGEPDVIRVTRSPLAGFEAFAHAPPRYVSFPSRIDDFRLHARIIEPPGMVPGRQYPVIIGNVYSGTARNQWSWPRPVSLLQQYLVHAGEYIVVQVDLRGSVGYGVDFREAFQGDWGGGDLEDLHSTVDYLRSLPHVDPERIGIWGNSYGGMMVLFALFERPGMFAAGIAGSPAVDPYRFTQYDQHLARRPSTHPEIFRRASLLERGEQLADPLMFIHGLHDDIVPFRTTLQLMEKLMLLGKDFEMVAPPEASHWWAAPEHYGVHTFRKFVQFFERHVPPGGRPATAARDGDIADIAQQQSLLQRDIGNVPKSPDPATSGYAALVSLMDEFVAWRQPPADGVADHSAAAVAERTRELMQFQARLAAIDPADWPRSREVDYLAVRSALDQHEFLLRVSRPWARDPGYYVDQLLRLTFTALPVEGEALATLRARLAAIPVLVDNAQRNLTDVAADYADLAIHNLTSSDGVGHGHPYRETPPAGVIGWYEDLLGRAQDAQPELVAEIERAKAAAESLHAWLVERRPAMTAKAGVGRELLDWYLLHVKFMPYSSDDVVVLAQRELERTWAFLALERHRNRKLPELELPASREAYERRIAEVDAEVRAFLAAEEFITVPPHIPTDFREMGFNVPWIVRPKGPNYWEQIQYRDPSPDHWHAVIPGHRFDQRMRETLEHPVRRHFRDGGRAEGWALYLEEVPLQLGFYEQRPRTRELIYNFAVFRAARTLGDVRLQRNEITTQQAVDFWMDTVPWLDEDVARVDAEIYLRRPPGYGLGYTIGGFQMLKLLADRRRQLGEEFSLREFHDEFMAAGWLPIALIRYEMTGFDDELRRFRQRVRLTELL
jgi:dipeptidyl-peptidase 4